MKFFKHLYYLVGALITLSSCQTNNFDDSLIDNWVSNDFKNINKSKLSASITVRDTLEISLLNRNTIVIQNDTSAFDVVESNTIKLILNSKEKRRNNYADFKFELIEENKMKMYDLIFSDSILLDRVIMID